MLVKAAWVFAVVFLAIGILGFVPGITADGSLLGIFEVDLLHNVIHIVTGAVAALAAWKGAQLSKLFFQAFGVVYAIVAVVGLVQGDTVLGLIDVNLADNILHVAIAAAALYLGFFARAEGAAMAAPTVSASPSEGSPSGL